MLCRETVYPETFSLLEDLSSFQPLKDFSLAGGTALALQIGHRISVDLDFFGNTSEDLTNILAELKLKYAVQEMNTSKNILSLNINNIKIDLVNYAYPRIGSLIIEGKIRLYAKQDIVAMKLAAIKGRGKKRDFYDLYFLLEEYTLKQMLDFHQQKFADDSEFLVVKSLSYFEDAENDPDPELLNTKVGWGKVKAKIKKAVQSL